ncbi:hypothetical protein HOL24_08200 [bacterium]|nr:hypothetical protein [bacterium]
MNIAIAINSEKKGFLCSVGELLESKYGYKVSYIARDKNVEKIIMDNLGSNKKIVRLDEIKKVVKINNDNIIKEAELLESKYNVLFSSLLAMNRGLGQGYFFNVKNVPHIRKSMWSYVEKIRELVINYKAYESILKKLDVVIVTDISPIIKSICSKNKCHNFAFSQTRFGDRYMWSSDSYMTSKELRDEIDKLVVQGYNIANDKKISYQSDAGGVLNLSKSKVSLTRVIIRIYGVFINEIKKMLLGNFPKNGYKPFAWIPNIFISWRNHRYLNNVSIHPLDIKNGRVVYMTLHIEPEISLFRYSPEFSNVYEAIVWISKSLPAGVTLVVKEHPISLAVRSIHFYKFLLKMPNVKLAHIDSLSLDWIKLSTFVSTITGSVGTEAVFYKKPVLSFGKHQLINHLPSVEYASNYDETKSAVKNLLEVDNNILDISISCLYESILQFSVDLPEFKKCNKGVKLEPNMSSIACDKLVSTYPLIFKQDLFGLS